ncbi:MAG TPA: thiamine pyrophosphate-binding protein, partial [Candidatus Atribacteria bacterium]|nr:thiamine pyrophosphate-binding protein [Candidatus Atribacteria bacterium]
METIRLTMAQALVKFLNSQYVEFDGVQTEFVRGVFTLFGHGNVLGLGQALEQDPGHLIVHQGRNEQGMAHAAMGYAKQKHRRQIYACTSSIGPGAANMVTAAATATANRIPVLFLPGDTYACRQPDPVLQQIEHFHDLNISTNDAFKAVSKYWDRITRPEQLMTAMINAMRVLTDPADTGAVTIALPQDVQAEAYDYPVSFFRKRVHRIERRPPTKAMIDEAAALIRNKKKPILICGGGVRYSEAAEAFKAFAEKFNIPFGETQAGKSAITWDHPLNLGGIGGTGNLAANLIAKEAD